MCFTSAIGRLPPVRPRCREIRSLCGKWRVAARGSAPHGSLKVTTSHLKAGYLRKNGVPYSENADLTEYYDVLKEHNGDTMLVVTIVVTDPQYLHEPFIITSHFKKQDGDAGWKPTPCTVKW